MIKKRVKGEKEEEKRKMVKEKSSRIIANNKEINSRIFYIK